MVPKLSMRVLRLLSVRPVNGKSRVFAFRSAQLQSASMPKRVQLLIRIYSTNVHEQSVAILLVRAQLLQHGDGHVEVGAGQNLCLARGEPMASETAHQLVAPSPAN